MPSSRIEFVWSKAPAASNGGPVLRIATALLMTMAAAVVLPHAGAWAPQPLNDMDLFVFLH